MRAFEVFLESGERLLVMAENPPCARFRAATLFKLVGIEVEPYSLRVVEISKGAA